MTPLFTSAPAHIPIRVIGSICALGALGTGLAFILNYGLVRDAGATTASTVTYVIPLFSTTLGVVLLGEHFSWNQPVGAALGLLGVAVSQGRIRTQGNAISRHSKSTD